VGQKPAKKRGGIYCTGTEKPQRLRRSGRGRKKIERSVTAQVEGERGKTVQRKLKGIVRSINDLKTEQCAGLENDMHTEDAEKGKKIKRKKGQKGTSRTRPATEAEPQPGGRKTN